MKNLYFCLLVALLFSMPNQKSHALSGRAAYKVKQIKGSLKYMERQARFGYKRKARKSWSWTIEDKVKGLLRNHPNVANTPEFKALRREIARVKRLIFATSAPPAARAPRTNHRRPSQQPPRNSAPNRNSPPPRRKLPLQYTWDMKKLSNVENTGKIERVLNRKKFSYAKTLLRGQRQWLNGIVRKSRYINERHPRVVALRRKFARLASHIRSRKAWRINLTSCNPSTCTVLYQKYKMSCPYNFGSTPKVRSSLRRDVDSFYRQVVDFGKAKRALDALFRKHPSCCSRSLKSIYQRCQQGKAHFQQRWQSYLGFIKKCRSAKVCRYAIKLNQHPVLGLNTSFLSRRIASNAAAGKARKAAYEAKVSKTSCPRADPRFVNPGLKRRVRGAVYSIPRIFSRNGWVKKQGKYHLMSRTRTAYNRWTKVLYELVDVRTCIWQTKRGKTTCRAFHVVVRRSKPKGSPYWNGWKFFTTRNSYRINCNSYR